MIRILFFANRKYLRHLCLRFEESPISSSFNIVATQINSYFLQQALYLPFMIEIRRLPEKTLTFSKRIFKIAVQAVFT